MNRQLLDHLSVAFCPLPFSWGSPLLRWRRSLGPRKPVRIIVPFAAGGVADLAAAPRRAEALGEVEPAGDRRQQARAPRATSAWARARERRPTATRCVLAPTGNLTVNQFLFNLPFDTAQATSRRSPCSRLRRTCSWCIRRCRRRRSSELIAYAKANPGKLNFASPGRGQRRAPRGRAAQHRRGNPDAARSLQGHRARGERPPRRQRADDVRGHLDRDPAREGRQARGDRDREPAALAAACPTCRPSPRAGSRAST